jgi:hypothetical protein
VTSGRVSGPAEHGGKETSPKFWMREKMNTSKEKKKSRKDYLKYVILAAALASMIFGIVRKEPKVVLRKATNICMECIGIG